MRFLSGSRKPSKASTFRARSDHYHRRSGFSFETLEDRLAPAVIVWDGGGNDFNWNNPLNWSSDQTPTAADIAIINDTGITITKTGNTTTIQAVQSAASLVLSGGTLTVTSGASQIDGTLTIDNSSLMVRGTGTSFTATAAVNLNGASLFSDQGGILALAGAASYTGRTSNTTIQATQGGSIDLSGITDFTGGQSFGITNVIASSGGKIDLSNLQDYTAGSTRIRADGSTSLIDLSSLTEFFSDATNTSQLDLRNQGTILLDSLTTVARVDIIARDAGTLFFSNALRDIDRANLQAEGGATIRLPQVVSITGQTGNTSITASGPGSVIDLSNVTTMAGGQNFGLLLATANSGGSIDLQNLNNYTGGAFRLVSEGAGSLVDLRSLPVLTSTSSSTSQLDIRGQGTIRLDSLTKITRVDVIARGAGTLFFSNTLSDINASNLFAEGGATIRLPRIFSYTGQTFNTQFNASGVGSLIDLSNLTTLTGGQSFGIHFAQALSGGQIDLRNLVNYVGGSFRVIADGETGMVDLRNLSALFSDSSSASQLDVRNKGTIRLDSMTRVTRVDVIARGSGTLFFSNTFTDIDSSNLFAEGGATIRLPNVVSYVGQTFNTQFNATGAGSLIDLSNLTTLTGGKSFGIVFAQALSGGQIDLQNLVNYTGGAFRAVADGATGMVDLRNLSALFSDSNSASQIDVRNGGTIRLDSLNRVTRVDVIARGSGTQFFSNTITDINLSNLFAEGGATIRLPSLVSSAMLGRRSPRSSTQLGPAA